MGALEDRCRALVRRAEDAGWTVVEERAIPYGRLMRFERSGAAAVVNAYLGKKGFKVVPAGKDADLLAGDLGLEGRVTGSAATAADPGRTPGDPFGLGLPRIGGDESGKGDWFGPLVVAAVAVDAARTKALLDLGVADSKQVADPRVRALAGRLDALGCGVVHTLMPRAYNERYTRTRNLNVLLAEMHAACVRELLERERAAGRPTATVVLIDRFASRDDVLARALDLPRAVRLVTRPRAEADAAVAAASLLARAGFLDGLDALAHEHGASFPPGAGPPVLRAGVTFVETFGVDALRDVAKLHFATTAQVQQRARRR